MARWSCLIIISAVVFLSCKKGKNDSDACNGDSRRDVKLMEDALAADVDTVPVFITIEDLGALTVPEVHGSTERQNIEKQVYTVRAVVDKVERERDGDYHIRLVSGDKYLITEIPNPDCEFASVSPYVEKFRTALEFVEANDLEGEEVEVTGVGFVDIEHYYARKQADNNIELHPILSIHF